MTKVKLLVVGPSGCGKTRISNFLADASTGSLPTELRPTHALRILEFDVPNLKVQNTNMHIEVQLWDCSGDEQFMPCWPALRKNANGVIFVFEQNDAIGAKKLDLFFNYFVSQSSFSPRQCIVFSHHMDGDNDASKSPVKLSAMFQRISHASVNLDSASDKLRYDFNQFLTSVVSCMQM